MSIAYCLEKPKDNDISKYGVIIVEGWAFSIDENIEKIEISYGRKKINAELNIERKDVAQCHNKFYDKALHSGFRAEINLTDKEKNNEILLNVAIFSKSETLKIPNIRIYPENDNLNIKRSSQIALAVRKTVNYLKKGKFPKNLDEFNMCLCKFKNIALNSSLKDFPEIKYNIEPYKIWCINNDLNKANLDEMKKECDNFIYKPLISIIMPAYKSDIKLLDIAIESVLDQIYDNWELYVVDDCTPEDNIRQAVEKYSLKDSRIHFYRMDKNSHISATTNKGVSMSSGEFIYLMDHDDAMTKDSLFCVVKELNKNHDIDVIYSDDDKITMTGERFEPQFKPDFSPELLLSFMYFSHIFVIRRTLFDKVGGMRIGYEGSQDYDLALRVCENTTNICHIPKVLYHWRATPTSTAFSANTKPYSLINGMKAVEDAVKRRNIPAKVVMPEFAEKNNLGIFALKYDGKEMPLISIIIPSKNHKDILERCINSIENKTSYKNYEIIIVDNESDEEETLQYLSSLKHKVIKLGNINNKFNFSRMVNYGIKNCDGEYVVLLNNDTEVIAESWLEDMLVYMSINGVGVVGSKLLYSDHSVQHGGVVLKMGNGVAGHAFKLIQNLDGGYMSFANVARNYSAVTAACFMTTKKIYEAVGGFDEENFAVSYNDVDFCMKVKQIGKRIVYNPQALLYHHEGKSRGVEQTGHFSDPKEEYNFINKWGIDSYFVDEYYNPNLSVENELFQVNYKDVYIDDKKPKNILLITHNLNFEGAPIVQKNISLGLLEKGYKFTVLSMQDGPLAEEYKKAGIDVIITEKNPSASCVSKKNYEDYLKTLSKGLSEYNFDLLYANTIECFWGIDLAEMLEIPSVWGIHESVNYRKYFLQFPEFIQQAAVECFMKATKVVYVSDVTKSMYKDVDCCNFVTIHNGMDISKINDFKEKNNKQDIKKELGVDENTKIVSIIGTICYRKGQIIFAEAAKKILEQRQDIVFYIVGGKEETYYQKLKSYIKENNLEDKVKILGPSKDVYKYYMASDVLVCASYEESSPMVILEGMSFKVPIVSTNVFGIPEQIRNGREGILVEPGKPEDIANSILKVIDNSELVEELTYNAFYRILMKFSVDKMLQDYDIVFQQACIMRKNNMYNVLKKNNM